MAPFPPQERLLKKGLPRPKNKDLRHEFDREIRTYVGGPDFLSSLQETWVAPFVP
jgi:hypothetical protein